MAVLCNKHFDKTYSGQSIATVYCFKSKYNIKKNQKKKPLSRRRSAITNSRATGET